jgi:hypothetical protein
VHVDAVKPARDVRDDALAWEFHRRGRRGNCCARGNRFMTAQMAHDRDNGL